MCSWKKQQKLEILALLLALLLLLLEMKVMAEHDRGRGFRQSYIDIQTEAEAKIQRQAGR